MIFQLIGGIRGILNMIGGAAIMLLLCLLFYEGLPIGNLARIPFVGPVVEFVTDGRVDRERKAGEERGRAEERAAWEEAQRMLQKKMDDERRAAQSAIDKIENHYLEQRQRDASALEALDKAITESADEKANDTCPARPAISRRLRDAINQIGRDQDGTGAHTAVP